MNSSFSPINRRDFLKALTTAGLGSMAAGWTGDAWAVEAPEVPLVPQRPFGRTAATISCLSLGGIFDTMANQHVLHRARQLGVTCWDTSDCYLGGRSETGYGQFFGSQPEARKDIFLITKSDARDPEGLSRTLDRSFERLQTNYIDFYVLHDLRDLSEINEDIRAWAEARKSEGRIRFFGFSTHRRMEEFLLAARGLGWLDGIMFSCNYRLLQQGRMRPAIEACAQAGLGLIVFKTQGQGSTRRTPEAEQPLTDHFGAKGWTIEQARLKACWENPHIASICSQMSNLQVLSANAAAARDPTPLTPADWDALSAHAAATRGSYCAGCDRICAAAGAQPAPVADIMRALMYYHNYGDPERARACLAGLSPALLEKWFEMDCSAAERVCPQGLPITRLVSEAAALLA